VSIRPCSAVLTGGDEVEGEWEGYRICQWDEWFGIKAIAKQE
jgi:hypothetical protein